MIPLLFAVPAAATALYGLYKGGKAVIDHSDAGTTNDDARVLIDKATKLVDEQRTATNRVLEDYGSRKLRAFNGPIANFIGTFGKLKNVEDIRTPELDKLQIGEFSSVSLEGLKEDYELLMDSGVGLGAGMTGGAALAFGAYNGTMMLATAGTGTAISTLSGAAATNATLAWLGGGSLAAGGGGIAMGTAILGGIVAGPALAIFGHVLGSKAEAALAYARSNQETARTCLKDAQRVEAQLNSVETVTALANDTFSKITTRLRRSVDELRKVMDTSGVDYRTFSPESREIVFRAVKFAQLIKAMIDTPILDKEGNLVLSSAKRIRDFNDIADDKKPAEELPEAKQHAAETADASEVRVVPAIPAPLI